MDEINDSTLSEEINRLHAEHRRYAQRLDELFRSRTCPSMNNSKKCG